MAEHAYNAPGIQPREFLEAVMCDPLEDTDVRILAATYLQQYYPNPNPEFPEDKTPLDYVAPVKRPRKPSKAPDLITRYEWTYLLKLQEYTRDTGIRIVRDDVRRLRDKVVIRNPK